MLEAKFFSRDAEVVARDLLGKILRRYYQGIWLSAMIIETEAYYLHEKASHASLGYTHKRRALFMPPGTIYMYYSRAGDSLNVSCLGEGNAVLIKSALIYQENNQENNNDYSKMLACMQKLNPQKNGALRAPEKLCSGQTLLCKSLNLKVPDWDAKQFDPALFYIEDVGMTPKNIIQTTRLGISPERDAHLPYRFISGEHVENCTKEPNSLRM